ncbi:arylsulfatase [Rhodopirellula rubra]|uniref:Arylsulfatase n=1 Tax=Aporhodopirellula rubra TaxID=980271 RepID=A0A7W5E2Q1_9BACT|nr:arylsulfatase [Aporhodopirellula rubra]MBB3209129.1 arylsulfatase [Aporhodopirellula rubra]
MPPRMITFALAVISSVLSFHRVHAEQTPNIILILADDMGYSDLGCYGSEIATPNLDRLAHRGVRFTQFYNSSKCEPTRASLMSGQYWQDTGFGVKRGLTMGEVMKQRNYATFAVGKWHLDGNPVDRGFDRYFGHLAGGSHYFRVAGSQRLDHNVFTQPPGDDFYMTDANAGYAIQFIDELQRDAPDKPFMMYLAFNAPHSPLHALPQDIAKYHETYRAGWDIIRKQRHQKQIELGVTKERWKLPPRDPSVPAWETLSQREKDFESTRMAIYAAMVDRMDQAIGRVLNRVKEHGEEDNTLVIFLSDNGGSASDPSTAPKTVEGLLGENGAGKDGYWVGIGWSNVSNTPFRRYKCDMGNGGILTSCVASWPAVIKTGGRLIDEPSHIIDLMATITDVAGPPISETPSEKRPGKSLQPLLTDSPRESHDALYFHLFHNRAIIADGMKLVSSWDSPWTLYDMNADRTEQNNLASRHPELAASLQKRWESWYADVPEKRWNASLGEPRYRRIDDPEETYNRRTGNGDEIIVVKRSEASQRRKPQPRMKQATSK